MSAVHGARAAGSPAAEDNPDLARLAGREPSPLANLVADVVHPFTCGTAMVLAVALHACWPAVWQGLGWGLVALVTAIGLPVLVLLGSWRVGWVSDLNVVRQDERVKPLCLGMAAVALAIALCAVAGVPGVVVELLVAMIATVAVLTALTLWQKVSFHAAGAAALMAVTGIGVSRWGWVAGGGALLAVGWARVRAGRHTLTQVLIGAVTGFLVAGGTFAALLAG